MSKKVFIKTYGCQMNVSDSVLMYGRLEAEGYTAVDAPQGADVVLVNTCAIRENAEQRVIGRLGELRRDLKADAVLGVTAHRVKVSLRSPLLLPRVAIVDPELTIDLPPSLTATGEHPRPLQDLLPRDASDPLLDDDARTEAQFEQAAAVIDLPALDRKSTRLNSSHVRTSRMPSSA